MYLISKRDKSLDAKSLSKVEIRIVDRGRKDMGDAIKVVSPRDAILAALSLKDSWAKEGVNKIHVVVVDKDGKDLFKTKKTIKLWNWADDESKNLERCKECGRILPEEVYSVKFPNCGWYCSKSCADKNLVAQSMDNNEETEFFI